MCACREIIEYFSQKSDGQLKNNVFLQIQVLQKIY